MALAILNLMFHSSRKHLRNAAEQELGDISKNSSRGISLGFPFALPSSCLAV